MFECEYFTDALGTKFPKRVKSNEIRILVDKSSRSVNFCYPSSFTSCGDIAVNVYFMQDGKIVKI